MALSRTVKDASLMTYLLSLVAEASKGLAQVERKRMFGCDAFFAADNIYALVWKDGRIGLRLRDPSAYAELLGSPGAEPWKPVGDVVMRQWVLVAERIHGQPQLLKAWVRRAHGQAYSAQVPGMQKARMEAIKAKVAMRNKEKHLPHPRGKRARG